jgi:hypothetical protein
MKTSDIQRELIAAGQDMALWPDSEIERLDRELTASATKMVMLMGWTGAQIDKWKYHLLKLLLEKGSKMKTREWKNAGPGKWTARITWYETNKGIRLRLQDNGEERFLTPNTEGQAESIWELFKRYFADGKSNLLNEFLETIGGWE